MRCVGLGSSTDSILSPRSNSGATRQNDWAVRAVGELNRHCVCAAIQLKGVDPAQLASPEPTIRVRERRAAERFRRGRGRSEGAVSVSRVLHARRLACLSKRGLSSANLRHANFWSPKFIEENRGIFAFLKPLLPVVQFSHFRDFCIFDVRDFHYPTLLLPLGAPCSSTSCT